MGGYSAKFKVPSLPVDPEREREYHTWTFKMLSRSHASSIVHVRTSIKFILRIILCADGHVTLHYEFQLGMVYCKHNTYSLSSLL